MKQETLLCTIGVADLYTMISQVEGVLLLKRMLDYFNLKQIKAEAMGSRLPLTIANCYMYFFEQNIIKQINNSFGIYVRYIDDIFMAINWPNRRLIKQVER
ncbi:unnamed protein product [Rotaria sp. Silwood1]|nr:unnamed protein product [Rotaria sp. Silwood1]CAF3721811.1 unnamed protein product [Rotaria sp. Silwood1]CAF3786923.1 unnamed protein product [Rotaria sp. Silwood1]CAF3797078.1 unnamed protein product [Rotaria sp. Silwood1]CAF4928061.1 unnamed protein product [Rotaria sp. Silwood1]